MLVTSKTCSPPLGYDLKLFSSALKLNTQYLHTIHFI